ncbi:unnamed protein product [[Candida] boidinii]|nr:unnamed protein product [[Candida] boidinii]
MGTTSKAEEEIQQSDPNTTIRSKFNSKSKSKSKPNLRILETALLSCHHNTVQTRSQQNGKYRMRTTGEQQENNSRTRNATAKHEAQQEPQRQGSSHSLVGILTSISYHHMSEEFSKIVPLQSYLFTITTLYMYTIVLQS